MELANLPIFIVIGAFAGWLAGYLMRGDLGLLGNTIVGILGAVIGGFVLDLLGLTAHGLVGSILTAIASAAVLLLLVGLLKKLIWPT